MDTSHIMPGPVASLFVWATQCGQADVSYWCERVWGIALLQGDVVAKVAAIAVRTA